MQGESWTRRACLVGGLICAVGLAVPGVAQDLGPLTRTEYASAFGRLADRRHAAISAARAAANDRSTAAEEDYAAAREDGVDEAGARQALNAALRDIARDLERAIDDIETGFYQDLLSLRARRADG